MAPPRRDHGAQEEHRRVPREGRHGPELVTRPWAPRMPGLAPLHFWSQAAEMTVHLGVLWALSGL